MSMESELISALSGICSDKVTDRRKNTIKLKELLSASCAPQLLTNNTIGKKTPNWETCFSQAHASIIKDAEKIDGGKTSNHDAVYSQAFSLLVAIVSKANHDKCYLSCNEILKNFMEIVKVNAFLKTFGSCYLNIVLKYVLPVPHYLEYFNPYQWADLYDTCISLCANPNIDHLLAVQLTKKVMGCAVARCHLILPIRDSMKNISELFNNNYDKQNTIQELVLEIAIIALENVGAESRLVSCAFTETIIPHVLKFYEPTAEVKLKKKLIFKFLHLAVIIHHPLGCIGSSPECLANDWQIWKKQFLSIQQLIAIESEYINNFAKKSYHEIKISQEFADLSVDVYRQAFSYCSFFTSDDNESGENPTKRMRTEERSTEKEYDFMTIFDDNNFVREALLAAYIKKYGKELKNQEKGAIIQKTLKKFNPEYRHSCFELTYEILYNLVPYLKDFFPDPSPWIPCLLPLWNELIRNILSNRKFFSIQHSIIQKLMSNGKDFPLDNLWKLYSNRTMPLTLQSIKTLQHLLAIYNNAISNTEQRKNVIMWLLRNEDDHLAPSIPLTLFQLVVKENIPLKRELEENIPSMHENIFNNMENLILTSDFHKGHLVFKEITHEKLETETINTVTIDNDLLEMAIEIFSQELDSEEESKTAFLIFYKYFEFLNYLNQYKIEKSKKLDHFFQEALIEYQTRINNMSINCFKKHPLNQQEISYVKELVILYSAKEVYFDGDILKLLLLPNLCKNTKNNDQDEVDLMEISDNSDKSTVNESKHMVLNLLAKFIYEKSPYIEQITNVVFKADFFDLENFEDFQFACNFILKLNEYNTVHIIMNHVLQLIQQMCQKLFKNREATHQILNVIDAILPKVLKHGQIVNKENCIIMLRSFLKMAKDHYYTPADHGKIFQCFLHIMRDWRTMKNMEYLYTECVSGLFSNIHSIRLFSACCIGEIFRNADYQKFKELIDKLPEIFNLDGDELSKEVISDEGVNRTSTIIHCILAIAENKAIWKTHAIAALMRICFKKNINEKLQKRATTHYLSWELGFKSNIDFYIYSWCSYSLPLDKFPFSLTDSSNIQEFLYEYKDFWIPFCFIWNGEETCSLLIENIMIFKKESLKTVLLSCSHKTMCCILSMIVYKPVTETDRILVANAKNALKYFINNLGEETMKINMNTKIGSILSYLTMNIIDKNLLLGLGWTGSLPPIEKIYFSHSGFCDIIKFLNEFLKINAFIKMGSDSRELQKQLVIVWRNMRYKSPLEMKIIALSQFSIFVDMICLGNGKSEEYLITFSIKCLLNIIKEKIYFLETSCDARLHTVACKILHALLIKILPRNHKTVSAIFSSIVNTLSRVEHKDVKKESHKILKYLFIDMKDHFKNQLRILDPLPKEFANINQILCVEVKYNTLTEYIESFIAGGHLFRYEALCQLNKKLRESKTELNSMCKSLKDIRGFSEDCERSILHKLAALLVKIICDRKDKKSTMEACRCLGEMGIIDYQTLILTSQTNPKSITDHSPMQYFFLVTLKELIANMFEETMLEEVTEPLQSLLSLKEGALALEILLKEDEKLSKELLIPFLSQKKQTKDIKLIIDPIQFKMATEEFLWSPDEETGFDDRFDDITTILLNSLADDGNIFKVLSKICREKCDLARKLFPSLVSLFCFHDSKIEESIMSRIQSVFDYHYKTSFEKKSDENVQKETLRRLLDLLELRRLQKHSLGSKAKNHATYTNPFTCLQIAWAACSIGAHFEAIYYCELWCEFNVGSPSNWEEIKKTTFGGDILKIMRKSYLAIGDVDAFDGCGTVSFLNFAEKRNYYARSGFHMDALMMHELEFLNISHFHPNEYEAKATIENTISNEKSYMESLKMAGLYSLVDRFSGVQSEKEDIHYESCWRLGDWSLFVDETLLKSKSQDSKQPLWNTHQYLCLKKSIMKTNKNNNENKLILNCLNNARQYAIYDLTVNELDSCHSFYNLLSKLQVVQDIEHFVNCSKNDLLSVWSKENLSPFSDFKYIEPTLSQRMVILNNIFTTTRLFQLKTEITDLQLEYIDLAIQSKCRDVGIRWLTSIEKNVWKLFVEHIRTKNSTIVSRLSNLKTLAQARIAWLGGQTDIALHYGKSLIGECEAKKDNVLYSTIHRLYGSWMVEARRESAIDILNNYLLKSLEILKEDNNNVDSKLEAYLEIGKFADSEYKQIDSYMKSSAFVNKVKCMESCRNTVDTLEEKLEQSNDLSKDERKVWFLNKGQKNIDEMEIKNSQMEREQYLQFAMRYYLMSLLHGEKNNLCVFRLISLWLDNPTFELNSESEKTFSEFLECIPSRKFLPLIPQLAPRLNYLQGDSFQEKLFKLIVRCVKDHPHQTLPIMLSLKNSNKDLEILNKSGVGKRASVLTEEPYMATARKILQKIFSSTDSNLSEIVRQTELMSLAFISLANFKLKAQKMGEHPIPKAEALQKIKDLTHALVPTVTLPVDYSLKYENIPSVKSFSDKFLLVGGVNLPKKLTCLGSDGIQRPLLLKGEDDIRQDAVMQQVFVIVNQLLNSNQETRKRHLLIRTYKVIALSKRSGIIEWCIGTEPLGRLLVGADGASGYHAKMRPKDMSSRAARELMTSKRNSTNEEKLRIFKKILSEFKAVFHHFFTETFLTPSVWYERRLAYTHSVATSSMIGYILGLGDRHVQNILIDKSTAEVIHIDLGIAFEQGRVQPTPETVPFRLTQDMVDGFGSAGVEGVFRKSCEKTMDVLKSNHETLLTILEVLLCDPLYMWTIGQISANKRQMLSLTSQTLSNYNPNGMGESSGSEAERALLRVRHKLEGSEFGSVLATPGQVSRLIQQATDINNLSRLFPGWQPYL